MHAGIREQYPEHWTLFRTIISLDMAANDVDRGMEPQFFSTYNHYFFCR
jgi:hypothetical protein